MVDKLDTPYLSESGLMELICIVCKLYERYFVFLREIFFSLFG